MSYRPCHLCIADVSTWSGDTFTQAPGVRQKIWLKNPDNQLLTLFKMPRMETGEAWSEQVTSVLGRRLGFDTAHTRIAIYKGIIGSLSDNFTTSGEEFFEGGDVLSRAYPNFNRRLLPGYEVEIILSELRERGWIEIFLPYLCLTH